MTRNNHREELLNAIKEHSGMTNTEIKEYAENGADNGAPGFIYYSETVQFYNDNEENIWELLNEVAEDVGQHPLEMVAGFNRGDDATTPTGFKNLLSWFVLEEIGRNLDDEDDEDEDEDEDEEEDDEQTE